MEGQASAGCAGHEPWPVQDTTLLETNMLYSAYNTYTCALKLKLTNVSPSMCLQVLWTFVSLVDIKDAANPNSTRRDSVVSVHSQKLSPGLQVCTRSTWWVMELQQLKSFSLKAIHVLPIFRKEGVSDDIWSMPTPVTEIRGLPSRGFIARLKLWDTVYKNRSVNARHQQMEFHLGIRKQRTFGESPLWMHLK